MPETRAERVLFALGIAVIGLLMAVIVLGGHSTEGAVPATPTTAPSRTVALTSTSVETTRSSTSPATTAGTTTTATTTTTAPPEPGTGARLEVTATADTWVSIRRDTTSGDVLFEGTLASGDSRSFTATRFVVRFGAAANVRARLNGKPLKLPGGTYSTTITQAGLGPRSA